MASNVADEIQKIRQDLDILTHLYARLVDRILLEEKPSKEDLRALKEEDEIVGEEELFKVLRE